MNGEPSTNTQVLYGTNINTSDLQGKLRNFVTTFVDFGENEQDYTKAPYYIELLKEINMTNVYTLDVNCDHIFSFDPSLYKQIENYPTDVIPIFDLVVTGIYKENYIINNNNNMDVQIEE